MVCKQFHNIKCNLKHFYKKITIYKNSFVINTFSLMPNFYCKRGIKHIFRAWLHWLSFGLFFWPDNFVFIILYLTNIIELIFTYYYLIDTFLLKTVIFVLFSSGEMILNPFVIYSPFFIWIFFCIFFLLFICVDRVFVVAEKEIHQLSQSPLEVQIQMLLGCERVNEALTLLDGVQSLLPEDSYKVKKKKKVMTERWTGWL